VAREHPYTIREALQNGLAPVSPVAPNAPWLELCQNVVPSEHGAVDPEPVTYPLPGDPPEISWPFPQLLAGGRVILLCGETSINMVDSDSWTLLSSSQPRSSLDLSTPMDITAGGVWHLAAMQDVWFLTNGKTLVFDAPSNQGFVLANIATKFQSICHDDYRLVLGGPSGAWFSLSRWTDCVMPAWREAQGLDRFSHDEQVVDDAWIIWGVRGGGANDIPYHTLLAALGLRGNDEFDYVQPIILEAIERGEIGMAPTRGYGKILAVKPLGRRVIGYGENGVFTLTPEGNTYREERVSGVGLKDRGAVAGDDNEHVFIGSDDGLWVYPDNAETPRSLRFEYLLSSLGSDIVVSYDPARRHYWISDDTICYVLNEHKRLGGPVYVLPTGLFRDRTKGLVGITDTDGDTSTVQVRSCPIDLNARGWKRMHVYQFQGDGLDSMYGLVYWRRGSHDVWHYGTSVPFNYQDVAYPTTDFVDCKIQISGTKGEGETHIAQIEARYVAMDRRARRGTKATPEAR